MIIYFFEMTNYKDINIENYNYHLPDSRIAKYPLKERDSSKLLIYKQGTIKHCAFKHLPDRFTPDELLVFNNTRVIQARLIFRKPTGSKIELFCLEPVQPADYSMVFSTNNVCTWKCLIGNRKKWKTDTLSHTFNYRGKNFCITAKKSGCIMEDGSQDIEFSWDSNEITFGEILENTGATPIPPYLNRKSELSDKKSYQTIYSQHNGSVAAPTAGLHFTDNIFKALEKNKIQTTQLTLHVGAGTFRPVKSKTIGSHTMHTERFFVSKETVEKLLKYKNITAVGTTSLRSLESIYILGAKLYAKKTDDFHISQWDGFTISKQIAKTDALSAILDYLTKNNQNELNITTQLIIVPGYEFRIAQKLITNYHQPKSTLLLLVAAFIGNDWRKVYQYALDNDFRFLSYGDSSLLMR